MPIDKKLIVGIADMKMARREGEIITYALGSCIGLCFYDPFIQLGALLHIMLPWADGYNRSNLYKYADSGIEETLRKMQAFGALKGRITIRIAGGAKMFDIQDGSTLGNIGQRNTEAVKQILQKEGIRISAEDTGSNYARTMSMDVSSGRILIKAYGKKEVIF